MIYGGTKSEKEKSLESQYKFAQHKYEVPFQRKRLLVARE